MRSTLSYPLPRYAAALVLAIGATAPSAVGSALVNGWYAQSCLVAGTGLCSTPPNLFGIPPSPSFTYDRAYHGEASYPFEPDNFTTADSHLSFFVSPGTFHALAETAASLTMGHPHGLGQTIAFGVARLNVDASDTLHFVSSLLPPGTPITYQITAVLDSTLSGDCNANTDHPIGDYASLVLWGITTPGQLTHSTCGHGSDHMTVSSTRTSAVGNQVNLLYNFQVFSESGISVAAPYAASAHAVRALNSAEVYINVLTPGVTFTSDSGWAYTAAPEPLSTALVASAFLILISVRRARSR